VSLLCWPVAAVLAVSLVGQQPALAAPKPKPDRLSAQQVPSVHGSPVVPRSRPAQLTKGPASPPPVSVVWPAAGTATVDLTSSAAAPNAGARSATATDPAPNRVRAGALPVWMGAPARGTAPARATVSVLDRASVPEGWRNGVVLRLSRADSGAVPAPASVSVDYSGFAAAFGADYANRLRLVALPACALSTPEPANCPAQPLPSSNDASTRRVTADVTLAAAGGSTMVALAAGPSGSSGTFAASSLSPSSNWSAGGNSGDFAWSYPIAVPPSLNGPSPDIALSYSSASVDGRNATTNNQPEWVGEGFNYWPGSIERSYQTCSDDEGNGANNTKDTGDMCWGTDNAVLSLAGHSGELVKDDGSKTWHLKDDDGTKIERLTDTVNADNDHEYWKLTTTDGTAYFFGLNRLPGYTGTGPANKVTNSAWTVPVAGNNAGEPCHQAAFTGSFCDQAWRWNLDYVVDPNGNTMSMFYTPESNNYASNVTDTAVKSYTRGGVLSAIYYGTDRRSGSDTVETASAAPMKVDFGPSDRCLSDCGTHDVAHWPDTPWDESCTSPSSCAGNYTPTFWGTHRLTSITTSVRDTDGHTYKPVDQWALTQSFPPSGDDTRNGLWLDTITHTGKGTGPAVVGGGVTLPTVSFDWVQMPNRVDTSTHKPPMNWMRLTTIWTDSGGKIDVQYTPANCTPKTQMPASPQSNTLRCYPVLEEQPDKSIDTEYFNKYLVGKVTQADWTGGGPDVITTYSYVGSPAWRHADDDGMTKDNLRTWSEFRGYPQVNTQVGKADGGQQTLTETRYFQGMNGDLNGSGGTRSVSESAVDLNGDGSTTGPADAPAVPDEDAYSGMPRQTTVYNGVESAPVSTTVYQPWQSAATATRNMGQTIVYARHTATAATWAAGKLSTSGWRVTHSDSSFDSYGMPTSEEDLGDVAVTGDEKCSKTSYDRNAGTNLVELPGEVDVYAMPCAATTNPGPASDADIVSMARTSYDGLGFGVAPMRGNATETDVAEAWTKAGGPTWLTQSTAGYDGYGRVIDAADVRGNHTTTTYTPATGPVTAEAVTTAQGTVTTTQEPSWGSATAAVDVNGRRVDVTYDALGRTSQLWQPNHTKASFPSTPSSSYSYLVRNTGGVNAVTTKTLNASNGYTTTIALSDGLLRARQTQTASLSDDQVGTAFADTQYDDEGRATQQSQYFDPSVQPSTTLEGIQSWQPSDQAVTQYDRAGRVVAQITNDAGNEQWRTTTSYPGVDRTNVTPPRGGTATTTVTDALGRTVEARQYHNPGDVGSNSSGLYDAVTYRYNAKGQQASITDSAGNISTYGYDLLGHTIASHDPDAGDRTATYNDDGDLTFTRDGRGQVLAYTYDSLGRKVKEFDTTTSGTPLASWSYDPPGAKGQLASSSRFANGNQYTITINSYSSLYKPTAETYSIVDSKSGLAGQYEFDTGYAVDGSVSTTSYPQAGGLSAETVTTGFDSTDGLARKLTTNTPGVGQYVSDTDYTAYGEPTLVTMQTTAGNFLTTGYTYDDTTHRLTDAKTVRQIAPDLVDDAQYSYDDAGEITKETETSAGDGAEVQCFGYDYAQRLADAWTPGSGDCGQTRSATALGGPAPYWQSWTFDAVGDRKTQTDHTVAGDTTATSAYPASGINSVRPHAVGSITTSGPAGPNKTDTYSYNDGGDTTGRPGTAAAQVLGWDAEGHLSKVTENTKDTTYVYDANGNRVLQDTPTQTTLYLPGEDLVYAKGTAATSATRYYSWNGRTIASRTAGGRLTWLVGDQQGTQNIEVDAGTQSIVQRRQTPYGQPRGGVPAWVNPRGFVGGTVDATGLVHEGAREYDPTLGRFISRDPLFDPSDPQSWTGYSYAGNNPVTDSDPTGMCRFSDGDLCADMSGTDSGKKITNGSGHDITSGDQHLHRTNCTTHSASCNGMPIQKGPVLKVPTPVAQDPPTPPSVRAGCPTLVLAGQCLPADTPQLHSGNLKNGADQFALYVLAGPDADCELGRLQIICYNTAGPNAKDRAETIGDVMFYPGSKDDFIGMTEREAQTRGHVAGTCDKRGVCLDPDYYGPDIETHEEVHSLQWAGFPDILTFLGAYGEATDASLNLCADAANCNSIEYGANAWKGGYWQPPGVVNGQFTLPDDMPAAQQKIYCSRVTFYIC
jgi:RHS repeat-associated protein